MTYEAEAAAEKGESVLIHQNMATVNLVQTATKLLTDDRCMPGRTTCLCSFHFSWMDQIWEYVKNIKYLVSLLSLCLHIFFFLCSPYMIQTPRCNGKLMTSRSTQFLSQSNKIAKQHITEWKRSRALLNMLTNVYVKSVISVGWMRLYKMLFCDCGGNVLNYKKQLYV
jgi:hypothetical protein